MTCQARLHLENKWCKAKEWCKAKAYWKVFGDDRPLAVVCKDCLKPLYEACCPPYTITLEKIESRK